MIIDAKDSIVGRIATVAAKNALLGETVEIVNCDMAVIAGRRNFTIDEYKRKKSMGIHSKGPFYSNMPDRLVRRIIRGMLPYKQDKGKNAFERIKCYIGVPKTLESKEMIKLNNAHISKVKNIGYVTIREICKNIGNKNM